MIQDKDIVF